MHEFLQANPVLHAIYHSVLLLPLLYIAYLIMEWLEHKTGDNFKKALQEDRRTGSVLGATIGLLPICGFSDLAASLYTGKVISIGTLVALFISTSGEVLFLLPSYSDKYLSVLFLVLIKFVIACICGFVLDLCLRNKQTELCIHDMCEEDHCHCEHNIWKAAFKHTLPIFGFIVVFNLVLSLIDILGGLSLVRTMIEGLPVLAIFLCAFIGFIPGCAPIVLLLELYATNIISPAALLAGLFTSCGTGYVVLNKTNKPFKHNLFWLSA